MGEGTQPNESSSPVPISERSIFHSGSPTCHSQRKNKRTEPKVLATECSGIVAASSAEHSLVCLEWVQSRGFDPRPDIFARTRRGREEEYLPLTSPLLYSNSTSTSSASTRLQRTFGRVAMLPTAYSGLVERWNRGCKRGQVRSLRGSHARASAGRELPLCPMIKHRRRTVPDARLETLSNVNSQEDIRLRSSRDIADGERTSAGRLWNNSLAKSRVKRSSVVRCFKADIHHVRGTIDRSGYRGDQHELVCDLLP